ncbi:MAG: nuclear transport factor 2 family protein [Geminicoccaceae bacterium]
MPAQTDVIREFASLLNARKEIPIARFFTEDFRLYDPGAGIWLEGYDGAQNMVEMVLAFGPGAKLKILDMIE